MKLLFRRPVLLLIMACFMLIYCVFEYNILLPVIFSFSAIGTGNFFGSIMSFVQLIFGIITSPGMLSMGMLYLAGAAAAAALVGGVIFAGFFNVINNVLENKPRFKGDFTFGIKKYFLKLFTINLRVELLSIFFAIFIMVACVPAIAATRAAVQGKPGFGLGAVVVDIITLCVVFFGLLFFRVYILFWYPAALKYKDRAFSNGKSLADKYFWQVSGKIVAFDLIFIVFGGLLLAVQILLMHDQNLNSGVMYAVLALDWIFKTIFFGTFIIYIFSFFKAHSDALEEQKEQSEA